MTNHHVRLSHSREATKKKKKKKSGSRGGSVIENGQKSFKFLQYQTLPYEMSS